MSDLKIVLAGGGSFNWTPRIVCNILGNAHLEGARVVLYNLNPDALALTHALALKYGEASESGTRFEQTTDRDAALNGGPPREDNLNAPNVGQVLQLPAGAVVETRGLLDAAGFHPLVSPMPGPLEAVVRPHALREELTVDAALEGSFEKALAVLTTDPFVGSADVARPLLRDLIAATGEWLPQFKGA